MSEMQGVLYGNKTPNAAQHASCNRALRKHRLSACNCAPASSGFTQRPSSTSPGWSHRLSGMSVEGDADLLVLALESDVTPSA